MPTPVRNLRVDDELWDAALAKARESGETLTDVIKQALREYVASEQRPA